MSNNINNPGERPDDDSPKYNAKDSSESASFQSDSTEPWRMAVAAAEGNADALLDYSEEIAALREELAAAGVSSDVMEKIRELLAIVEQVQRNAPVVQPPPAVTAEIPTYIAWLLWLVVIWLTALTGALAGHIDADHAAYAATLRHEGGLHR